MPLLAWRLRNDERVALEAWVEGFSSDSYLPMLRLAKPDDSAFLNAHRGPGEAARYRRLQRQLLKEYLRSLSRDFHRLHTLADSCAPHAPGHDSGETSVSVDEKMAFIFSVWSVEVCLTFWRVKRCNVDLKPLLSAVSRTTLRAREATRRRHELRTS
jgi:hypothetical protein